MTKRAGRAANARGGGGARRPRAARFGKWDRGGCYQPCCCRQTLYPTLQLLMHCGTPAHTIMQFW